MRYKTTLAAVAALSVLTAGAALAHTSIAESNPADNSSVEALPEEVSIRFGNATVPAPQPAQLTEATLLVLDPCGARVDKDDAQWDDTTSTITATTAASSKTGRYEMHWSGKSTDGDSQAGIVDFVVSGGSECAQVVRPDAADDIDLGFDPTRVVSKPTDAGAAVTVTLAGNPSCKSFAAGSDGRLTVDMDTNWDDGVDYSGAFTCKVKKVRRGSRVVKVAVYKLAVTKAGDETPSHTWKVKKSAGASLTVSVPASILDDPDSGTLDLFVSSTTDSDECGEDTACVDRAPDLGWIRSF